VEETPKKTVLKKHSEPAKGAAAASKSTVDKKSTTKSTTVSSRKDASGDPKKAKGDSPPLRKSKVELKGARDSPSPSVRKSRTEEVKSKSSLQASPAAVPKGKDRRHSPSPATTRKPAVDEIKIKRQTSKSPSPTTQAKKQGECAHSDIKISLFL